jgi:D-glycero-alpha-D-manno-heptose-7-phosphate kinase
MIITRSPLRISLGGGGTDLPSYYQKYGGYCISAAINKYVFISVMNSFQPGIYLKYSEMESVDSIDKVNHPIIREALKMAGYDLSPLNVEITTLADIPAGTGLGSSSSFATALLLALYSNRYVHISPLDLAKKACEIEIDRLKEPIGRQDQYVSAVGGIVQMSFNHDDTVEISPLSISVATREDLERNLVLFFTGFNRKAGTILQDQVTKTLAEDASVIGGLHHIKSLALDTKAALESGDTKRYGEIMHEHWMHKRVRSKGMTNPQIDEWYELGRKMGAIGGKIIGAGGGGFLMFYTEDRHKLSWAMHQVGLQEVSIRFDYDGTRII